MERRIIHISGWSQVGKTTLIADLTRLYTARGLLVMAIKHTHHELNHERTGDTQAFIDAGALVVILAREHQAVVFSAQKSSFRRFTLLEELIRSFPAVDVVLIEGFKNRKLGIRFMLEKGQWQTPEEVAELVDRIGSA